MSSDALNLPIQAEPHALYKTYPFKLQFKCSTPALRKFINGLMEAKNAFFIIRALKIQLEAVETPLKALGKPAAGSPTNSDALSQKNLNVTLQIDLIEFKKQSTPSK